MPDQLEDAKEVLPKKQTPCQINCEPSGHDRSRCPGAGRHEMLLLLVNCLAKAAMLTPTMFQTRDPLQVQDLTRTRPGHNERTYASALYCLYG